MPSFSYTDTSYMSYDYAGTVLQTEPDCKSHDSSSKGLVTSVVLQAEKKSSSLGADTGVQTPVSLGR